MNKITLITSEGCVGCEVMKKSITNAISQIKTPIALEVIDNKNITKQFKKRFNITDTPCTIFFKNDKDVFKTIGSVPTVVVIQWIKVYFN